MTKKLFSKVIAIIAILGIMVASNSVLAYSGDGYSIDIPETYKSAGKNAWAKSTGDSINIQIQENKKGEAATKSALDDSVEQLKKQYASLTVEKSEVTTVNGYKCLYILSKVYGMYIEQYAVPTKDKIYVVTVGAMSEDSLKSEEVANMVKSFKIDNYKEPKSGLGVVGIVIGAAVVGGIVAAIVVASKKKAQNN